MDLRRLSTKILSVILCAVMILSAMPLGVINAFASADTVPEGYTGIYDIEDLDAVRNDLDGNYILMADIDMTEATAEGGEWDYNGTGWRPIGENNSNPFSGIFDGNGHKITGMRIKDTSCEYVGLFGYISRGTVKNLRMVNADIQDSDVLNAGTIAGYAKTSIFENIAVDNLAMNLSYNYSSNDCNFGGIVGVINDGGLGRTTISKCYVSGSITARGYGFTYVGGIVGNCWNETIITDCYNASLITGSATYSYSADAGGISGYNGTIKNCINIGVISENDRACCGAISSGRDATISHCYYKRGTAPRGKHNASDTAETAVALTAGQMKQQSAYSYLDFENTWVLDVASGAAYPQLQDNRQFPESGVRPPEDEHDDDIPDGYIGIYDIADLYSVRYDLDGNYILMTDIDMTEATAEGGEWDYNGKGWRPIGTAGNYFYFSGIFDGNGHSITGMRIKDASASYVGLFGYISGGTVKNLRMVNADIQDTSVYCAGTIAGYVYNATIENIAVDNLLMNVEADPVQALCLYGSIIGNADNTTINKSYASGEMTVSGNDGTVCGGIVGSAGSEKKSDYSTISDCYNTATIKANSSSFACAGGISGYHGTITNCVNIGTISGSNAYIGAITYYGATLSGCYYKQGTASSGKYNTIDTAETAVALTEEQMKQQSSYSYLDFDNTWFLDTDLGMTYPMLQSCPEKILSSVEITSYPVKTAYLHHEELDVTGLQIAVNYIHSSTPKVIAVTPDMVTGYDATVIGTQTLTVTYLGKTATFDVVVAPRPVTSVTLDKTAVNLEVAMTEQLTATVLPDNATDKALTWTSDAESVVTVDNTGLITVQGTGTATVTVTASNGVSATATINVLDDHAYGDAVTTITATCFAAGSACKTCSVCGHVENITLPVDSTNHSGGTEVRNAVAGNCGEAGYTGDTYCLGCNTKIADGEEIPATENHDYDSEITTPSTCSVPGVRTYTCTVCDYMYTEAIESDPDAHDMSEWEVITEPTCNTDGRKVRKCAECGQLSLSRLTLDENTYPESDHDYLNNENKDYTIFGYEGADKLYLTFSSSTYFEDGCDYLFIYDGSGDYIGRYTGNSLAGKTITIPGDSFSLRLETDDSFTCYGFSFDSIVAEVSDGSADYVSIPATGNHDYVYSTTREATCSREGEITYTCSDCGDSYAEIIEKTAHTPGDWQIITGATADTDGIKIRCCTVCGTETDRETIPAGTGVTRYLGDASGDGKVTAADARLILRHSARIEILPDNVLNLADVNGDGRVNASDARIALRMASKLEGLIIYGSV